MKKIIALALALLMLISLSACGKSEPEEAAVKYDVSVACLKGPTGLGMLKMMSDNEAGAALNNYAFTVASSPDELTGKIVNGEINITSVPTNLAAKLNAKTGGKLVMLAVNTLGSLSFIENGTAVNSIADLKGKTVYSTGQGANPEYILRHILKKNGLDPDKDVNIVYLTTNDEMLAALVSGKAEIAMVPEPAATTVLTKKNTLRRALNVNDEWNKISDKPLMMGCVVAQKSYVEANPEAVASFLTEYEASVSFVNTNIAEASALAAKYEIIPSAAVAEKAIPNSSLTYIAGGDMQTEIEGYFKVLLDADAASIGGAIPDANFYYSK